jgi:plastocyanin
MRLRLLLAAAAAVAALVAAGTTAAMAPTKVLGSVGPGFTIGLKTTTGKKVTTLKPGAYTFVVADKSDFHNFHLSGPGVNRALTGIGFVGAKTVTLTLKAGIYRYICQVHPTTMKGSFTVH